MKIQSLVFLLPLIACSTAYNSSSSPALYQVYTIFKNEVTYNLNRMDYRQYFDKALLAENANASDTDLRQELKEFIANIATEKDHYEKKVDDNTGCLSINGYNSEQRPITLNFEYRQSIDKWVIKQMDAHLLRNNGEFSKKATCPKEYMNQ